MWPAIAVECSLLHELVLVDFLDHQKTIRDRAARRDAVYGNVVCSELRGEASRVFVHSGLGHGINRPVVAA